MPTAPLHPRAIAIEVPPEAIAAFCARWQIAELSLFGSVLREDFGADSDINVLISPLPGVRYGLLEIGQMEDELAGVFGREATILTRRGVQLSSNPIRRKEILDTAEVVYARR